jgi:hypothetical protein
LNHAPIDADVARQAIDLSGIQRWRRRRILGRKPFEQAQRAVKATNDVTEGENLAAAVRINLDIMGE